MSEIDSFGQNERLFFTFCCFLTLFGPDLYISLRRGSRFVYIVAGGVQICVYRCGRVRFGGLFLVSGGPPIVQIPPYSLESHLQIAKIKRVKILKRESLFSEEKKPENHFFASNSFAIFFMVKGVGFRVRN